MANIAYGISQGLASGAQSASGLLEAGIKEDADKRAANQRLQDNERLLAAQEAMQERIAENAYQRQQRPNQAAGELLREAGGQQMPVESGYTGPRVNVSGTPDEVRAKLNAIPDPQGRAEALAALDAQEAAQQSVAGKTRAPTRDEQIQNALRLAIERGDAVSYERLKMLAGEKYQPLSENGMINTTTGEIIGGGSSRAERERERDERQYDARMRLQNEQEDRRDQRALMAAEALAQRDEQKALRKRSEPLPAAVLKQRQGELDAIGTASGIQADLAKFEKQIDDGKLSFGLAGNRINRGMNATGLSSEESRNFASFQSGMEKLRNDSLRLNAGVQTDGDAQRAWNELFANINDTNVVRQRLREISQLNARAAELRKNNVDLIQQNYGREPFDFSDYERPMSKQGRDQPQQPQAPQLPDGWSVKVRN